MKTPNKNAKAETPPASPPSDDDDEEMHDGGDNEEMHDGGGNDGGGDDDDDEDSASSSHNNDDGGGDYDCDYGDGDGDGKRKSVPPPNSVAVSGLPWKATEHDIADFFRACDDYAGPTYVDLILDEYGRSSGKAVVVFETANGVEDATALDGHMFGYSDRFVRVRAHYSSKPDGCKKVFVRNLPFEITADEIRDLFAGCGTVKDVHLSKDEEGKPRGCGRVEFEETEATDEAVKLNGSEVHGWEVQVTYEVGRGRRHTRGGGGGGGNGNGNGGNFLFVPAVKPRGCTTIFVGNLPFDAQVDAVRRTFEGCGQITRVHFMKERDSDRFRGMAFVSFADTDSTDGAVKLAGTDFMGRPMMVSYAKNRDGGGGGAHGARGGRFGGRRVNGRGRAAGRGRGRGYGRGRARVTNKRG